MQWNRAAPALALAALALGTVRCNSTSCIDLSPDVGSVCVPDALVPDQTSVIEVREACGQCSSAPQCSATLRYGAVIVELHSQICSDTALTCPSVPCLQRIARCTLPGLAAGDYSLVLPGNQLRLLRVRNGGQRSCRLPSP